MTTTRRTILRNAVCAALLTASGWLACSQARASNASDVLYVGDAGDPANFADDTVKRFDARTGAYLGVLVHPVPLIGPTGLIVRGSLYVANQNTAQPFAGDILRYNATTGTLLQRVVSHEDRHAPFAPRGMVLWNDDLFVADFIANEGGDPGRVLKYTLAGKFVQALAPKPTVVSFAFHPRGVVIGPDRRLYVSNFPNLAPPQLGGQVLQFEPESGKLLKVFISNDARSRASDCTKHLHRPEGLVFGPGGNLYITAFRADANDTDKILVFAGPLSRRPGACLGVIALDEPGRPRSAAQALLFGPDRVLFVPITNAFPGVEGRDKKDSGAIRRYRVGGTDTLARRLSPDFVAPGGPLVQPWYLSFGRTDPGTLAYRRR